jgi:hypothetical protein
LRITGIEPTLVVLRLQNDRHSVVDRLYDLIRVDSQD